MRCSCLILLSTSLTLACIILICVFVLSLPMTAVLELASVPRSAVKTPITPTNELIRHPHRSRACLSDSFLAARSALLKVRSSRSHLYPNRSVS